MSARAITLATPLEDLPGLGRERTIQLGRLKRFTVQDLLFHRPRRYEDRRQVHRIADLEVGSPATVRGKVLALGLNRFRRSQRTMFELILDDGSARLHCRWWNLPFMQNYFRQGDEVFAYGKLNSLKPRTMDHPETEVVEAGEENSIHINRITPIYPLTEGLPQRWLRALIWRLLHQWQPAIDDPFPDLDRGDFPLRSEAVLMTHFPESYDQIELARKRLALDEFLDLQLHLQ
jgi:ATP-dependent DNA helicase RecG